MIEGLNVKDTNKPELPCPHCYDGDIFTIVILKDNGEHSHVFSRKDDTHVTERIYDSEGNVIYEKLNCDVKKEFDCSTVNEFFMRYTQESDYKPLDLNSKQIFLSIKHMISK